MRGLHDNLPPVRELLDDVLACTVALLKHPPDAALAVLQEVAADLLSTVAARVRPPYLLTSPLFADLVSHAPRLCEALTTDTRAKLTVAITHVFLLPWFDVSDAQQVSVVTIACKGCDAVVVICNVGCTVLLSACAPAGALASLAWLGKPFSSIDRSQCPGGQSDMWSCCG